MGKDKKEKKEKKRERALYADDPEGKKWALEGEKAEERQEVYDTFVWKAKREVRKAVLVVLWCFLLFFFAFFVR
jgi:hypothetical protein